MLCSKDLKEHYVMKKYYDHVVERTSISTKRGQRAVIPIAFRKNSAAIISRCSFLQGQILKTLYSTHGPDIFQASANAQENRSPNARMEFLCSTRYGTNDEILSKVFSYSQAIFREIYGLRNVLAHEIWMSCDDYMYKVLFSKIEEEERVLKISGRLRFDEKSTSREAFDAIVRYIGKIKIISCDHLECAIRDIDLCEWILMTINHILEESDPKKKNDLKMAFLTFNGTSHLFEKDRGDFTKIEVRTSKKTVINR